jgi:hypothetical protein
MTEAPFRAMDEFDVFMVSNHLTFAIIFIHLITEQTW